MLRPDLAPALLPSEEDEQLQQLKMQSSWLDPHSENAVDQWHDRVKDIVQRSTGSANPGKIELIGTGENVVCE